MKLKLFAADLDGTLLPNTGQQPAPGCLERTRYGLVHLRQQGCLLCYTSNRGIMAMRKSQRTYRLPEPDYWICHLGTEIYHAKDLDKHWQQQLGPAIDQSTIRQLLARVPGLVAQEFSKQSPHKFSWHYAYQASVEFRAQLLHKISAVYPNLRLVHSLETTNQRTIFDFIPDQAGNAGALHYLMQSLGLTLHQVFFAGDSGTDIDACIAGFYSGVVGNATPAVQQYIQRLAQRIPGANPYLAQACYGDGIIESLYAHQLLTEAEFVTLTSTAIPDTASTPSFISTDSDGAP